ncbi:MAG: ComEC/Rec2 family competence protein [Verrucomicrobiota bacterium]|nr:ComEC/Rec2 family competence protein [Verrucomicrobiota bacterium]
MKAHSFFWNRHLSFLYALTLLIAAYSALFTTFPLLLLFWSIYLMFLRKWSLLIILPFLFLYSLLPRLSAPPLGETRAIFSPSSLQKIETPFNTRYLYKGKLFLPSGSIRCTISYPDDSLPIGKLYVSGLLEERSPFSYQLKVHSATPLKTSFSLAAWRYEMKNRFRLLLEKLFSKEPRIALFFFALTTGELHDRFLRYQFGQLGLEHILGVSGFHFALLTSLFSLGFAFPYSKKKKIFLLLLLSTYYLFVGQSPAVERCWLVAMGYLISHLFQRPIAPINLLSIAMIIEMLFDPLSIANIGFQLSFSSCFAIALFFPPINELLSLLWPKKRKSASLLLQPLFLCINALRSSLSLTIAVNIFLLPLLLFQTNAFPPLSIFYNLFYPFCADVALLFLALTLLLYFLFPPLTCLILPLTHHLASWLLDLAALPPLPFTTPLLAPSPPKFFLPVTFFLLLSLFATYYYSKAKNKHSLEPGILL